MDIPKPPPPPPADRWIRLSQAAARVGVSPRVLRRAIEAGQLDVRLHHLGPRGLCHVANCDVEALAARLSWGPR